MVSFWCLCHCRLLMHETMVSVLVCVFFLVRVCRVVVVAIIHLSSCIVGIVQSLPIVGWQRLSHFCKASCLPHLHISLRQGMGKSATHCDSTQKLLAGIKEINDDDLNLNDKHVIGNLDIE